MAELWTALAMVLVVEGLCYALFPQEMIRFMRQVLETPPEYLRKAGLMAMAIGVVAVWLIRHGNSPIGG